MKSVTSPSQDERIMGALSHLGILLPMWGLILSAVIWINQRDKSNFVRQQAAQAMAWQIAQFGVFMVGMVLYMLSFVFLIAFSVNAPTSAPPPFLFVPFGVMGLISLGTAVFIITGIVAAVKNLQGNAFLYPLIGYRVKMFLLK